MLYTRWLLFTTARCRETTQSHATHHRLPRVDMCLHLRVSTSAIHYYPRLSCSPITISHPFPALYHALTALTPIPIHPQRPQCR